MPGHILSRIYNCTKRGYRPIDNATTAHFTTAQIVINCTLKYALPYAKEIMLMSCSPRLTYDPKTLLAYYFDVVGAVIVLTRTQCLVSTVTTSSRHMTLRVLTQPWKRLADDK